MDPFCSRFLHWSTHLPYSYLCYLMSSLPDFFYRHLKDKFKSVLFYGTFTKHFNLPGFFSSLVSNGNDHVYIYIHLNLEFYYMKFYFIHVSLAIRSLGINAKSYVKMTSAFNQSFVAHKVLSHTMLSLLILSATPGGR